MVKKSFEKEAVDLRTTEVELTEVLKSVNMFNKSGSPKAKYVKAGIFTEDGDIRSPSTFEKCLYEKLS
jgi:type III secretory pathway lipoprotein EscJ